MLGIFGILELFCIGVELLSGIVTGVTWLVKGFNRSPDEPGYVWGIIVRLPVLIIIAIILYALANPGAVLDRVFSSAQLGYY